MSAPITVEKDLHESYPAGGFLEDRFIDLTAWRVANGSAIPNSAANIISANANTSGSNIHHGLTFATAAGATDVLRCTQCLPGSLVVSPRDRFLALDVLMAKQGSTDEVPTLAMNLRASIIQDGQVDSRLTDATAPVTANYTNGSDGALSPSAIVARTLGVARADARFFWYRFNLTPLTFGTGLVLPSPGDALSLTLSPSATVGTSDNKVVVLGTRLVYQRHAGMTNRLSRFPSAAAGRVL
jgi:hypothetical protein